jgi:chemotaxis protein MotB
MSRSKRGHGGGHHGGAWKVAYADFVTSMMALFLVLWLVGSDEETKLAVQRYFRGELTKQGQAGTQHYSKQQPFQSELQDKASRDLISRPDMRRAMERMRDQLNNSSEDGNDLIRYDFLADGVRITVIDSSAKPFFDPGTAHLTTYGQWVLKTTAWYLDRFPFQLEVEGHTQKGAETTASPQNRDWDISTERAIAARDLLQDSGLDPERFWRVIGYSDREPLEGVAPESEENRRITIVARLKPDQAKDITMSTH